MTSLLDTLASYLPAFILRRIALDATPLSTPIGERLPGAVLFADISGFTAVAERLNRRGPEGAEELSSLLNMYFGQLIDLVTAHGGDIVKFAGDGLLAVWQASEAEPLPVVTRRAAQCGLAIQSELLNRRVASDVSFSMRVGVAAGDVFAVHVGGVYQRWEYLIAGSPLAQVAVAERQAQPGQVVLSPGAWALIQPDYTGWPAGDSGTRLEAARAPLALRPLVRPTLRPEMEAALRSYIPVALLSRMRAGQGEWLAELRRVSVLFINLPELSYRTPLEQAHKIMRALQTTLYHFEGSINQLAVDDKGASLVAALGLPPLAHEDDAKRSVQAALALQATLRELDLHGSIGVTTGRTFCGTVGNSTRRSYSLVGDSVNLAARLMQAGPSGILCDATTYQAVKDDMTFESLPPITVKGKAEPVAIYRPLGELKSSAPARSSIIGRVSERAALAEGLEALRDGSGGLIIIEGEAGIGKSRLVEDAVQLAQRQGIRTLLGAGDAMEQSTPYHAWRPIFSQLFRLDTAPAESEQRRTHILAQLETDPDLLRLAPLLNAVLPVDIPDNELTAQMSGQVRADNTSRMLTGLLQKVAESGPLLLIMEDAHWLDSASWTLTMRTASDVRPVLQVIAARPMSEPLPLEYRHLLSAAGTMVLRLAALSSEETVKLVCQRLGVAALPEEVSELIRRKAEGHPFFSEELAYALRDEGLIIIAAGECRLAPHVDLKAIAFPDTVQGVVTSRIDRLAPAEQLVLKVASVIGRVFAFQLLKDIYPIGSDRTQLLGYLDTLERLDLTPLETPEPNLAYVFKHVITQEVAYNLMLFAQRRELHSSVAKWYEDTQAADLSPYYPLLAYHWGKAEAAAKTLEYLEKAGEQALRGGANREAAGFFSEALRLDLKAETPAKNREELLRTAARHGRWERLLGQAYYGLGQLSDSREQLHRSVALLDHSMATAPAKLVLGLLPQFFVQISHRMWPARFRERTQEKKDRNLESARAYSLLGSVYYFTNESVPVVYTTLHTLNLAERADPSLELAEAYANSCVVAGILSLHALARGYGQRARQTAQELNQSPSLARVYLVTSLYDIGIGQWDQARHALEQAIAIYDQLGDRNQWGQAMVLLLNVSMHQGDFKHEAAIAEQLYEAARGYDNRLHQAWGLNSKADAVLRLGQTGEAVGLTQDALVLYGESIDHVSLSNCYARLAIAQLRQGQSQAAREAAQNASRLFPKSSPTGVTSLTGYSGAAEAYLSLWEAETQLLLSQPREPGTAAQRTNSSELRMAAQNLCRALKRYARVFPIGRPHHLRHRGLYNWLDGKPADARKAWLKSVEHAKRLAMPYEEAQSHYELGRHAQGAERQEHLSDACEIFERLGAAYDLVRARQFLSKTAPAET